MNAEGKDVISLGIGSPYNQNHAVTLCNSFTNPDGHCYQPYVISQIIVKVLPGIRNTMWNWIRQRDTAVDRFERRNPAYNTGFRQPMFRERRYWVPNPDIHLYLHWAKILGAGSNHNPEENAGWMPDLMNWKNGYEPGENLDGSNYPKMPSTGKRYRDACMNLVDFAYVAKTLSSWTITLQLHFEQPSTLSILSVQERKECCIGI